MIWEALQNAAQTVATPAPTPNATSDLLKALAGGALGLIGTIVTIAVGWLRERDGLSTKNKALEVASKRVTFWATWYNGILPLDGGGDAERWKVQARTEMSLASNTVEELFHGASRLEGERTRHNFDALRRGLPRVKRWLLFYSPSRKVAWIPRALFYIYVFVGPAVVGRVIVDRERLYARTIAQYSAIIEKMKKDETDVSAAGKDTLELEVNIYSRARYISEIERANFVRNSLLYNIEFDSMCIGIGLAFRFWSLRLERPRSVPA
jgi:hypothetical protein